jgi:hypothetical protein
MILEAIMRHLRGGVLTFCALGAASAVFSACGSPATPAATTAVTKVCQQVSAVLSDGPDQGADPIGYAEAQVLPLRQIHTADRDLRAAIDALASAYQQFFQSDGTKATADAVSRAGHTLNAICPGAVS